MATNLAAASGAAEPRQRRRDHVVRTGRWPAPAAVVRRMHRGPDTMRWFKGRRLVMPLMETSVLALPLLALVSLFAGSSTGCLCDCEGVFNKAGIRSPVPIASLSWTGEGCGEVSCELPSGDGGACSGYALHLTHEGVCHFIGTAADGRQASADVTVRFKRDSCCGKLYDADGGTLAFPGAPDGSAGADAQ